MLVYSFYFSRSADVERAVLVLAVLGSGAWCVTGQHVLRCCRFGVTLNQNIKRAAENQAEDVL